MAAPFVILNAAALAPERVDVELFGAEAGWQRRTSRVWSACSSARTAARC